MYIEGKETNKKEKEVFKMKKTIYFDMDGTIANLYEANNWLERLLAEEEGLFLNLEIMHDKEKLTEIINDLIELGFGVEVITWTPKDVTEEYVKVVEVEKKKWIERHFPMIKKITCLRYGTPKQKALKTREHRQILVDDNIEVNEMWNTPKRRKSILADNNLLNKLELLLM